MINRKYMENQDQCSPPYFGKFVDIDRRVIRTDLPGYTQINLIAKSNFQPIYTYITTMDWNNLIYNLGGTAGAWIGFTALSFPNLFYSLWCALNYKIITNMHAILIKFNNFIRIAIKFIKVLLILIYNKFI